MYQLCVPPLSSSAFGAAASYPTTLAADGHGGPVFAAVAVAGLVDEVTPWKPFLGLVYANEPSGLSVSVPMLGPVTSRAVRLSAVGVCVVGQDAAGGGHAQGMGCW